MPKTIAITPSWYWPEHVPRLSGVPPFHAGRLLAERFGRHWPEKPALIDGDTRITGAELASQVAAVAEAIKGRGAAGSAVTLTARSGAESVVMLLGGLAAGCTVSISDSGAASGGLVLADSTSQVSGALTYPEAVATPAQSVPEGPESLDTPAVAVPAEQGDGSYVAHSHRSLLAGAISTALFLQAKPEATWLTALPLSSWAGLNSVTTALFAGAGVAFIPAGDADSLAESARTFAPATGVVGFAEAFHATKEAKKSVKAARGCLNCLLLPVGSAFDGSERRRIEKTFDCAALTIFGQPATGPVLASHPSWYLAESAGIPVTNADVVPVDPRSGNRIQTLWELVEFAAVNVRSPMAAPFASTNGAWQAAGPEHATGVMASSDANGMIYLLPPGTVG